MKFDVLGRIDNMRLPDGKAAILYSVYEAVSNSIHSIEDRFGKDASHNKGMISVEIATDDDGYIEAIYISDNGAGFHEHNLQAFDTCDTRSKAPRGGKGIGRLIWVKVFESIRVESQHSQRGAIESLRFRFYPLEDTSIQDKESYTTDKKQIGAKICLEQIRPEHKSRIRRISFLRDMSLHFFSYFMAGRMPHLEIIHGDNKESLSDFIKSKIEPPVVEEIYAEIEGQQHVFEMSHMYVDTTISTEIKNCLLFTAHHRQVGDPVSIERKFALKDLGDRKAYVGVVKGEFLDQRVDQERIDFKVTTDQFETLKSSAIKSAEKFLSDHIREIRTKQKKTVNLLLEEHPQLAAKVEDVESYVSGLSPNMDEEQIGENLFTLLYRDERKISKRIREISSLDSLTTEAQREAEKVLRQVSDQAKHRLSELVVKRRQVLSLAKSYIRYQDDGNQKYYYEKAIHDLICPLGKIYSSPDYQSHNLWVIDDLLAYYSFFASDKQIRTLAPDSESSQEPDIIFFNPLGFHREGTNDPVVLVEFKRPGDETPSKDPVDQVLEYIERLKDKTVRDINGEVVSDIRDATRFECYIICDLTKPTRRLLSRSQAPHETPDGEGYFGFAPNHKAAIHVISFRKMLRDAELRNEVFFRKLGLVGN